MTKTILFMGDSITDCGRRDSPDEFYMGTGYPYIIQCLLGVSEPGLRFINRGIAGDRACDLKARWEKDCLAFKPDVLSILIGINDTWRRYDSGDITSAEEYKRDYRHILTLSREQNPGLPIIMMEPFLLPCPEDRRAWREDLDPKIHAARELALEFSASYIPLDGIFNAAAAKTGPEYWAFDGVHPSPTGHGLIAEHWLEEYYSL